MQVDRLVTQLPSLFEFLNQSGFRVTMKSRLDVHDLLLNLSIVGESTVTASLIQRMISPVLCKSQEDQRRFNALFFQWEQQFSELIDVDESADEGDPFREFEASRTGESWTIVKRLVSVCCIVATVGFLLFAKLNPGLLARTEVEKVDQEQNAIDSKLPETSTQSGNEAKDLNDPPELNSTPDAELAQKVESPKEGKDVEEEALGTMSTRPAYLRAGWVAGLCLVGIAFLVIAWWALTAHIRKRYLNQRTVDWDPEIQQLGVRCETAKRTRRSMQGTAKQLRKHMVLPTHRLDIHETAVQTARNAGLFSPVRAEQKVSPSYLVLIQRDGRDDQQAQMIDDLINQLESEDVDVTRYYYRNDPRICRQSNGRSFQLSDLAASHSRDHLLVFGEASAFLNPISGAKVSWLKAFDAWTNRALLVASERKNWSATESALAENFVISSASQKGLASLIDGFQPDPALMPSIGTDRYPAMLRSQPERWLEREAPDDTELDLLLDQLRDYLGKQGYQWLSSCAVYPTLHHHMTLWAGDGVKDEFGQLVVSESDLMRLARLPWMRHGRLPDWLRARLISDLSPQQEKDIRDRLETLLRTASDNQSSNTSLSIAHDSNRNDKRRKRLRQDHTFVSFWSNPLSVRIPRAINSMLPTSGNWTNARALAACAIFVCVYASCAVVLPREEIESPINRWRVIRLATPAYNPYFDGLQKPDDLNGESLFQFEQLGKDTDFLFDYRPNGPINEFDLRELRNGQTIGKRYHASSVEDVLRELRRRSSILNLKEIARDVEHHCESDLDIRASIDFDTPRSESLPSESNNQQVEVGKEFHVRIKAVGFAPMKIYFIHLDQRGLLKWIGTRELSGTLGFYPLNIEELGFRATEPTGPETLVLFAVKKGSRYDRRGPDLTLSEYVKLRRQVDTVLSKPKGERRLDDFTMRTIEWETVQARVPAKPTKSDNDAPAQTTAQDTMPFQDDLAAPHSDGDQEKLKREIKLLLQQVDDAKDVSLKAAISMAERAFRASFEGFGYESDLTMNAGHVLAGLYFTAEYYPKVVPLLQKMIAHAPKQDEHLIQLHIMLGIAYEQAEKNVEAFQSFKAGRQMTTEIALRPLDLEVFTNFLDYRIGNSLRRMGEFARAEQVLLTAHEKLKSSSMDFSECQHSLLLLNLQRGHWDQAFEIVGLVPFHEVGSTGPKTWLSEEDYFEKGLGAIREIIQNNPKSSEGSTLARDAEKVIVESLQRWRKERLSDNGQATAQKPDTHAKNSNPLTPPSGDATPQTIQLALNASQLNLTGLEVRMDADVIRITVPTAKLFRQGTSEILPQATPTIEPVVEQIQSLFPRQRIGIEGHTDNSISGPLAHKLAASQAAAVLGLMTRPGGLPIEQLFTLAHGANHPRSPSSSPAGRAANRRIEIVIYPETFDFISNAQETSTTNEALADLVMSIQEPRSPRAGSEVTYEIKIKNRGGTVATDVRAIAQFSSDIEPIRINGGSGEIVSGQVLFDPINIEPRREIRLKIIAVADKGGQHRFRAEVRSGETELVSQETTRFVTSEGWVIPTNTAPLDSKSHSNPFNKQTLNADKDKTQEKAPSRSKIIKRAFELGAAKAMSKLPN